MYGEADAGRIWHQTLVKFLLEERGFTQSKYDPCLFWKLLKDGSRIYIVIYVDDGFSSDNGSKEADNELEAINARFKIEIKPASFFLGNNVSCHSRSRVTLLLALKAMRRRARQGPQSSASRLASRLG